jgi:ribonuclease D
MVPMNSSLHSPTPILIQAQGELASLVHELEKQPRIAVDTESDSLYAYPEKVCLLQFSVPGADYLLDPLAFDDLGQLSPLFSNPRIEKVLHGAEYDVAVLKRDFGFEITNLFDTRVAARTLGVKRNGLEALLSQFLGMDLDKRYQRANWGQRPLPEDMIDYARLDTHFLLPLRDQLMDQLKRVGRLEEALEACAYLAQLEAHDQEFNPQGFWRINGAQQLKGKQLAALRELYLLREQLALRLDRPPFKVLGDRTLLDIARSMPREHKELRPLHGMTRGQIKRFGDEILQALARGQRSATPTRPRPHRRDEAVVDLYERLRRWRKRIARERRLDSDLILPREMLWGIAHNRPDSRQRLKELLAPLELREERYGEEILALIHD